jgi:asparagine synthase (glutamine-hydrolysing)
MSGIAGVARKGETALVTKMLEKIKHRGRSAPEIITGHMTTFGRVSNHPETIKMPPSFHGQAVWDGPRPPLPIESQFQLARGAFSLAAENEKGILLARDGLGIRPLYYGRTGEGTLCFASEVKGLMEATRKIHEFPPGYWVDSDGNLHKFYALSMSREDDTPVEVLAAKLRLMLEQAVIRRIDSTSMGCWLSGGVDSSAMAALVRPHVESLHTFAGGLEGASDLDYARQVAKFIQSEHHEVIVDLPGILKVLPEVIYQLESFDALLVRSSVINFLVAEAASQFVDSAFSGEGGDELFGGYHYLKDIPIEHLKNELMDITGRLHNTALQRVDRSASAHGLVIYVPLLDLDVVELAMRIPHSMKTRSDGKIPEKNVLRLAMVGDLPNKVLWRSKEKFWKGAGVGTLLEQYAREAVSEADFIKERTLPNGWQLNSKEELMYYRIFREHYGGIRDLSWMGRSKNAPVAQ